MYISSLEHFEGSERGGGFQMSRGKWMLTFVTLIATTSSSPSKVQIVKEAEDFKDFKVEVLVDVSEKSRGDVCERKCAKGDLVLVHYERKLVEKNGRLSQMLDSR